jgi:hypothetical protein
MNPAGLPKVRAKRFVGGRHMSMIDKQHIAAVEILTNQGYRFRDGAWSRERWARNSNRME